MSSQWLPAFALCILIVSLRLQHAHSVLGARQYRSSTEPLRCFEKGERADGACVRASVRNSDDRPAVFHRLWSVGRPDMAMWIFTRSIFAGEPIRLFNNGNM